MWCLPCFGFIYWLKAVKIEYFWGILKPMCFHVRWPQHWSGRFLHFKLFRKVFVEALLCTGPSSLKKNIANIAIHFEGWLHGTPCGALVYKAGLLFAHQHPSVRLLIGWAKCLAGCWNMSEGNVKMIVFIQFWNFAPKPHSRVRWLRLYSGWWSLQILTKESYQGKGEPPASSSSWWPGFSPSSSPSACTFHLSSDHMAPHPPL